MRENKVLIVIDMQKGSFTPKTSRFDTKGTVNRINEIAEIFREKSLPVIFIQHDGTKMNEFIPRTQEWELLDSLHNETTDIFMGKTANDIFYNSGLQSKLEELKTTEIFITGCATDFCVESSIQSALAKDFDVTVVSDGHTTGDRPHLESEKVIEHYNWVWQNMIPTKGTLKVKSLADIKKSFIEKIPVHNQKNKRHRTL